jgi:hypothetical protein
MRRIVLTLALLAFGGSMVFGQPGPGGPKAKPKFGKEITDIFFTDAREKLGPGAPPGGALTGLKAPDKGGKTPAVVEPKTPVTPPAGTGDPAVATGGWGEWLGPEVLEAEVKAQATGVANEIKNGSAFKAAGFKKAQVQLTMLTVMFGVIAQYPGEDVRWKKVSAGMRDELAKAAAACKTGDQYASVKIQGESLAELVRGSPVDVAEGKPTAKWGEIADFKALMKRMDQADKERLKPLLSAEKDFKENKEQIMHEASVMAVLAEVIQDAGYDDAGDDQYLKLAKAMKAASIQLIDACKQDAYENARTANAALFKTCSDCHTDFR